MGKGVRKGDAGGMVGAESVARLKCRCIDLASLSTAKPAHLRNAAFNRPQVIGSVGVCPHPTGKAPISPQAGWYSGAQGEPS